MKKPGRCVWELCHAPLGASAALFTFLFFITFTGCEKHEEEYETEEPVELKSMLCPSARSLYFGHEVFTRATGKPFVETRTIENPDYACFDNFVLKVKFKHNRAYRVTSAEIKIDGITIVSPKDFIRKDCIISKRLSGLTPVSLLEVELRGTPGSYIDLWIEGTLTATVPVFAQIGPLEQYSSPPALPLVSDNGITGTWSPEYIDTGTGGTYTFTFTPDAGQCSQPYQMIVEVLNLETVTDAEGNIYSTVKIGPQLWMAENLKTTRYRNGDLIATTTPATLDISGEINPEYQWAYGGNETNALTYGRCYTWYAVTDSRNVCPEGWHVPSDDEWTALTDYLTNNGFGFEGSGDDIAKSMADTSGWKAYTTPGYVGNDQISNNSSGFTARPAGVRSQNGTFFNIRSYSSWWSTSEASSDNAWFRGFSSSSNKVIRLNDSKKSGVTIRCVKD